MSLSPKPTTRTRATRSGTRRPRGQAKAIVAIAAGTALLLGGAGTYAFWSTQTALGAAPVSSGDLDLSLGDAEWTLQGVLGQAQPVADVSAVRIVPGDVLTLTQALDVTLIGDTIEADLAASLGATFAQGLGQYLDVDLTLDSFGTEVDETTYHLVEADITDPDGTQAVTATLTITFDPATANRDGVNSSVNLEDVVFTLTQTGN
ncbi:alternate-type signal peptide domain-containing protein [Microbacterium sp. NPDC090007]|uniref:alternate-type signal peptide domain-containing protein n=1 Tax=Microbacterium sp. NPDC090007 TaxID=3364204 RepID=UPI0037FB8978